MSASTRASGPCFLVPACPEKERHGYPKGWFGSVYTDCINARPKKMRKQPDFTALFFDYFGGRPRKVAYEVRHGSSRWHDLVFLNSLVHDARFCRKDIWVKSKRLVLPVNRDCWELPRHESEKSSELHIANARLSIYPVKSVVWSFDQNHSFSADAEMWLDYIWLERTAISQDGTIPVVLAGYGWRCTILADADDLEIKLRDLEVPYLYSERHGAEP